MKLDNSSLQKKKSSKEIKLDPNLQEFLIFHSKIKLTNYNNNHPIIFLLKINL
jgi:hypothetical protein